MHQILIELRKAVVEGQIKEAQRKVTEALAGGIDPALILNEGMIHAMAEVGGLFQAAEIYVPEMLIAARAMQGGLALLKPYLVQADVKAAGKVVIGTVRGDLHDIGKNLVAMMLEGAGFEVIDLGSDVSPEKFVAAVKEKQADILALSALLTTTMPQIKATLECLQQAGLRDSVKVIVGGAPVTESYAQQIGADGYSPDASRAADIAKAIVQ